MDRDALLALLSKDKNLYEEFKGLLLKEGKRERESRSTPSQDASPVTVYTKVIRRNKCIHCGYTYETEHSLRKGESLSFVKGGKASEVIIVKPLREPLTIEADIATCVRCLDFVKSLSREDLESRYMALLRKTGLLRL